jgi:hypothetical protein
MKIKIDDKEILELSETQKKVIRNDIPSDVFDEDMERRVKHVLTHKYEQCFKRLKEEWEPKMKARGVESIPLDADAFAEQVFALEDYKNRSQRGT